MEEKTIKHPPYREGLGGALYEKRLNIIKWQIRLAGQSEETCRNMEKLERGRITQDTVIPPQEFLFRLNGKPCFPVGEIVSVTGKQKSGKTFFCSILMALALRRRVLGIERIRPKGLKMMWLDTEQSRQTTQKILVKRLRGMLEAERLPDDEMDVFNMRANNWQERLGMAEAAVGWYKPDIVVFDGVRDCVDDINDQKLANDVATRVAQLSSGYTRTPEDGPEVQEWPPCCVVCVIHENKSPEDNSMRGAIGSEFANKSYEVYECTKDVENLYFTVKQKNTREYDIQEPLRFRVNDNGLPTELSQQALAEIEIDSSNGSKSFKPQKNPMGYNPEYVIGNGELDYKLIFDQILPYGTEMRATDLMNEFKKKAKIKSDFHYAEFRKKAEEEGLLMKKRSGHYVYYCINPGYGKQEIKEQTLDFEPPQLEEIGKSDVPF